MDKAEFIDKTKSIILEDIEKICSILYDGQDISIKKNKDCGIRIQYIKPHSIYYYKGVEDGKESRETTENI